MIPSYPDKRTQLSAGGGFVPEFQGIVSQAERRLAILNAAPDLSVLQALPSNRLEALKGDRRGFSSIRINRQWCICFLWPEGQPGPSDVEVVEYH